MTDLQTIHADLVRWGIDVPVKLSSVWGWMTFCERIASDDPEVCSDGWGECDEPVAEAIMGWAMLQWGCDNGFGDGDFASIMRDTGGIDIQDLHAAIKAVKEAE